MRLARRIADAGLTPQMALAFAEGLREIAGCDGGPGPDEAALIRRLLERVTVAREGEAEPIPLEEIWTHAELFLTACVYVAVVDGQYGVEEARRTSEFAHRLGFSARQLAALEARVFGELKLRAAQARPRLPAEPQLMGAMAISIADAEITERHQVPSAGMPAKGLAIIDPSAVDEDLENEITEAAPQVVPESTTGVMPLGVALRLNDNLMTLVPAESEEDP